MARIGQIIKHEIETFIKLISETRKGFNETGELYNSSGIDAPPVKKDRVILIQEDGTGKFVVCGVLTKSQKAKPGEVFVFSRDADGILQSLIKMLNDGTIDAAIKKDLKIEITGDKTEKANNITEEATGDKTEKANNITEEATAKFTIKGVNIEISGSADIILKTIGSDLWFPNCIPTCPFGIPHGGAPGGISGLKGQ